MSGRKTKTRQIYEKAYTHFGDMFSLERSPQEWWVDAYKIDRFIMENPHKDFQRGIVAVLSAIAALRVGADMSQGSERSVEGSTLMNFYWAGRHRGFSESQKLEGEMCKT